MTPTATRPTVELLPGQPQDRNGPVFREAWEAQAFAMTLALYEKNIFTWPEWAAALASEIKAAQTAGDPDLGTTYYQHWLKALERLLIDKGVSTRSAIDGVTEAWIAAAEATPHGQPIVLGSR